MSMLLSDAKTYVARIIAAQDDPNLVLAAGDAIASTMAKWNAIKDWTFLLQDNSIPTVIAGCIIAPDGLTVTNATPGAIFGVNVGQTVTGTGIPAATTVATVTETSGNGITSFTLSAASTPAPAGIDMTFSAYIPIIAGTNIYYLPPNFQRPYTVRFMTSPRTLVYYRQRELDRKVSNQSRGGVPTHYTIYNVHTFNVGAQHKHMKLYPVPGQGDTLFLKYYRRMDPTGTYIDIPDSFLYVFLDDARVALMRVKAEDDQRLPILMKEVETGIQRCVEFDELESEDEDVRLFSQKEAGEQNYVDFDIWTYWDI